jgi:hypothetical protein
LLQLLGLLLDGFSRFSLLFHNCSGIVSFFDRLGGSACSASGDGLSWLTISAPTTPNPTSNPTKESPPMVFTCL